MEAVEAFKKLREDFPMLGKTMHGKPLVYLDTAATAQKPKQVIDAMQEFYTNHYGTVHRAIYELAVYSTDLYQKIRVKAQRFLNAEKPEEIIYTRGTTESINLVASSFGKAFVKAGDEIIVSEIEHHSNIVPWQILCEERGAKLLVIPVNDAGELKLDVYKSLLSSKTKLVAIGHVSNALGTENPVKEIIREAHGVGAKVLVDGAQAAPHLKVDVQDLSADFYVFSGHKLYGPTGIGILYGKEELLDQMPPYQGGGDMIERVSFEKTTYNTLPMKFEAGTPMIAEVMGMGAAIDYVEKAGLENIRDHEQSLLHLAEERLSSIKGLKIIGQAKHKGAILSFVVKGIHPLDIGTMLDLKGFALRTGHHCAQPAMRRFGIESTARASFGLYNTKEEVERFYEALSDVIRKLS
ncbi:cysteine desulfurase [Estrella lausannensis]|uniref:Probable cysteine desulfurase n=1 Tax=Estrella lausannensis TaxID=483423 RepID=A0A0H5DMN7_9BACT|nr:cysteine desulfurase [Estrella lausannensis]CRX37391.1 Cysteine desulfurase [Estrella lausannensis]